MRYHNRRSFLKTNTALGLGALSSGIFISRSCTNDDKPSVAEKGSPEYLLSGYQECLGGPFPDPVPLNPVLRETITKDGYHRVLCETSESKLILIGE